MELQGKKATHDFLSLYSSDSSFQLQDARPSSQGFFLKTRDFLQPLERVDNGEAAVPTAGPVLPGAEAGAYTIAHAADAGAGLTTACAAPRGVVPIGLEAKPEPDYGSRSTTTSYGSYGAGGASYALWDDKDTASRGQWPSHFAAARGSGNAGPTSATAAASGSRQDSTPEKKRLVEAAATGSSRGYEGVDDDEEYGKRDGSSSRKDLTIKVNGKASCTDQRPNTPRSKHSATEQRRRSKINDRFQILRELIPHSDQRRDKASFLLEVIEYIRFLQEKVHKHESPHPGWIHNKAKLTPWPKSSQAPANDLLIPSHVVKNDSTPALVFSTRKDESNIPVVPPTPLSTHNPSKTMEITPSFASDLAPTHSLLQPNLFHIGMERDISQQKRLSEPDNMASQDGSLYSRSYSLADCSVSKQTSNEHEQLTVDEGTIRLSTAYSHGLLTTLTQALKSSGIDLSGANISVQINLGKRAVNSRHCAATTTSTTKDLKDPASFNQAIGYSRVRPSNEESSQASKRLKAHG
ncbi:transcription factor BIM2 [Canna indica]|uniref:Transcription factor BIM2 n=1 Tax=Canna indica TaxID=4628 RepID=A0AAQ3JLU8_9LILI|nr:transcription factor BIM2 [Canna indica]